MCWNYGEKHFLIFIRVQVVGLCILYKTVDHVLAFVPWSCSISTKFFTADRKGADALLSRVVIHKDVIVVEELSEVFLHVDAVTKGSSDCPVLCHLGILLFELLEIGISFLLKEILFDDCKKSGRSLDEIVDYKGIRATLG